jgi:hypothetical protein
MKFLITLLIVSFVFLLVCNKKDNSGGFNQKSEIGAVENKENNPGYKEKQCDGGYGVIITFKYPEGWEVDDGYDPGYLIGTSLQYSDESSMIFAGAYGHEAFFVDEKGGTSKWKTDKGYEVLEVEWFSKDNDIYCIVSTISDKDKSTIFEFWLFEENDKTKKIEDFRWIVNSIEFSGNRSK